jgi:nucleoside-diphosphate-sugar epimerase
MRVLIVGCGYVGLPLGAQLAQRGHEVDGMNRNAAAHAHVAAAGIKPLVADITKPETLTKPTAAYDWVVNCVSSTHGGVKEYREVYLRGNRNLLEWLSPAPPERFVYTSSTSVYGQTDGSWVEETSLTEPTSETAKVLVQTERLLLKAAPSFPAVILRVAGIYGPDRGYWFKQFLKNEARIEGRGDRNLNMIHRDDVVGAIIAALERGHPGEIYDAVDDEPVSQLRFYQWLSNRLGKPLPPSASEAAASGRKRGLSDKRVSNRKMKLKLGYQLKYPTFREGFLASGLIPPETIFS